MILPGAALMLTILINVTIANKRTNAPVDARYIDRKSRKEHAAAMAFLRAMIEYAPIATP